MNADLDRCEREIGRIRQEPENYAPGWLLALAEADWQAERREILEAAKCKG